MKSRLILGAISSVVVLASTSQAGTISTTFPVLATVEAACTVVTATDLAFGDYTPSNFSSATIPVDSTVTIEAQCANGGGGPIQILLDDGLYSEVAGCPAIPSRRMAAIGLDSEGAAIVLPEAADTRLPYGIYFEPERTVPIGCTLENSVMTYASGISTVTLYGRIPGGANVVPASYQDLVTVTVNF